MTTEEPNPFDSPAIEQPIVRSRNMWEQIGRGSAFLVLSLSTLPLGVILWGCDFGFFEVHGISELLMIARQGLLECQEIAFEWFGFGIAASILALILIDPLRAIYRKVGFDREWQIVSWAIFVANLPTLIGLFLISIIMLYAIWSV